jgi:hypothetical protein
MGAFLSIFDIIVLLPIIIPVGIYIGYTSFSKYAFYLLLISLPIFMFSVYTDKGDDDDDIADRWKPSAALFSGIIGTIMIFALATRGVIRQNLNSTSLGPS